MEGQQCLSSSLHAGLSRSRPTTAPSSSSSSASSSSTITRPHTWCSLNPSSLSPLPLLCHAQHTDAYNGHESTCQNADSYLNGDAPTPQAVSEHDHALNPEIWGMVPPELLERIIAKLPITSVLRFRAVCRRWNQLPFDKQFPKLPPHQVGACPPFLSRHFDIFYIDGSGKWRTIPFHFFPLKHVILEASGGGLLLFSKSSFASRLVEAFYVCNPITKQWHEVQGFSVRSVCVTCIDVNHLTLDFKVVIAGWVDLSDRFTGRSPLIEIYDSRNQTWSTKYNIWDDDFFKLRGVALVRGTLYLAVHSRNFSNLKVLALHVEDQTTEFCGGFGERSKFHCFGQYRGNLTAVVQSRGVEVMEIWQLKKQDNGKLQWVLLDRLADEKLNAFSSAAVAGGFVFFNYYDEPIAVYDLREQSWRWVDFPPGRKYSLGMRPLAFQPSFVPLKLKQ